MRAPGPNSHGPARDVRASADDRVAEESLSAHAGRLVRRRASAAATAFLQAIIASLQRLHKAAGGAQDTDRTAEEDRRRPTNDMRGGQRDVAQPSAAAATPAPKRRLRSFLVYLSVLLAGGMGGAALGYNLLAKLLDRQFTQNGRLQVAISKHSKSAAATRKELESAQSRRIEAEKKLEAYLAEHAKTSAEKQKRLDEAENRLAAMLAAERAGNRQPHSPVSRNRAGGNPLPAKTGDCNVNGNNVSTLKDCINAHDR